MKKSTILGLMLICLFSICSKLFGQAISANEQCKKLGRGVNIIGYDKELWKDYTKGRFKEEYFKMIKEAGFSLLKKFSQIIILGFLYLKRPISPLYFRYNYTPFLLWVTPPPYLSECDHVPLRRMLCVVLRASCVVNSTPSLSSL